VFAFVLQVAVSHKLLKGKTIAVDSTTLEANAAMKSLVRRATHEDWKTYVKRLMKAEGIEDPSDDEVRRFDRTRKKKTSNKEWMSATDADSRVAKMKDGRTHLADKAEHAVELGSGLIVAAVVYRGDDADAETWPVTVELAREQLTAAGSPRQVDEVVGDKGYHKADTLQTLAEVEHVRAYIAEPKRGRRTWVDKPEGQQHVVYANRQRITGTRGRRLGRQRSEYAERSFAHTCETGGGRRAWLRGVMNVSKHHLMHAVRLTRSGPRASSGSSRSSARVGRSRRAIALRRSSPRRTPTVGRTAARRVRGARPHSAALLTTGSGGRATPTRHATQTCTRSGGRCPSKRASRWCRSSEPPHSGDGSARRSAAPLRLHRRSVARCPPSRTEAARPGSNSPPAEWPHPARGDNGPPSSDSA